MKLLAPILLVLVQSAGFVASASLRNVGTQQTQEKEGIGSVMNTQRELQFLQSIQQDEPKTDNRKKIPLNETNQEDFAVNVTSQTIPSNSTNGTVQDDGIPMNATNHSMTENTTALERPLNATSSDETLTNSTVSANATTKETTTNYTSQVTSWNETDQVVLPSTQNDTSTNDALKEDDTPSTLEGCMLQVDMSCLPPLSDDDDGDNETKTSSSCEEHLVPEYTTCDSGPTELVFKFNGGICNNYNQPQDAALYFCQDFGEGPAFGLSETNYIEALPPRKVGDVYFEGQVSVGDTFRAQDTLGNGGILDEEILVMVYADSTKEVILQIMVFHTKCQADLTLGDKYGSLQLMSFTNDAAGTPTMYMNITYQVTITNMGSDLVHIGHVITIEDQMAKDLLGGNKGPILEAGGSESVQQNMLIDLTHARTLSTSATISGRDDRLNTCAGFGVMQTIIPDTT